MHHRSEKMTLGFTAKSNFKRGFLLGAAIAWMHAFAVYGVELKPWIGTQYSLDLYGSCLIQQFEELDTRCGVLEKPEVDAFYDFSALMAVKEFATVELQLSALNSKHQIFGLSALRLTGRYFFLNDIIGDLVSLAAGVTVSQIFHAAKRNIATFDHGGIAFEGHVAIGKEFSCEQFWTSRAWSVIGLGIADAGYPWLRANLVWERNWWEIHQFKLFAESLWGFGHKKLSIHPFHGYGPVRYQAIDLGLRYSLRLENDALLSIGYAHRVLGRNCPRNVNFLKLEASYPFSL